MGGDEFVVVMPGMDAAGGAQKSEEFVRLIRRASSECIGDDTVRVSIGRATYPGDGADAEDLLATADRDMYAVKSAHRFHREARFLETSPGVPAIH